MTLAEFLSVAFRPQCILTCFSTDWKRTNWSLDLLLIPNVFSIVCFLPLDYSILSLHLEIQHVYSHYTQLGPCASAFPCER